MDQRSKIGQVDHVDSILNEFMQNKRNPNFGFNEWLDPHEQQQQQQQQQPLQQHFPEWHPDQQLQPPQQLQQQQQRGDGLDLHRLNNMNNMNLGGNNGFNNSNNNMNNNNNNLNSNNSNNSDYYLDYGNMIPEQSSSFPNYELGQSQQQQGNYYGGVGISSAIAGGDMSARYHQQQQQQQQHDVMNNRSQPARHHIQQVHPRSSALHTTNIGVRPPQQQQQQIQQSNSGLYPRGTPSSAYTSPLPPSNLLVHQQYRPPARPYEDRYLQHTPPPQAPQIPPQSAGQSYSNMSHYDLSAHIRNQGALNWSTVNVQVSGNNPSRSNQNQNVGNRPRYPPQSQPQSLQQQQLSSQMSAYNPTSNQLQQQQQQQSNSSNFLGGNQPRPLLSQSPPLGQRNPNGNNNNIMNNGSGSAPNSMLNRNGGIGIGGSNGISNNNNNSNNNDMAGRDIELEQLIYRNAKAILAETANRCLKSVELANALRDRIGKEALQRTKVLYGGLLVLLELYRETFAVHRIPKNDMVELLAYVAPNYASHSIQHPQQLLASQIPGYNMSTPNLNSNTSFPNGSLISGSNSSYPLDSKSANSFIPPSPTGAGSGSSSFSSSETTTFTLYQYLAKHQIPTKCLFISNVPDDITGNAIWAEFGGEDIVEKVSVDYQGEHRTGVVWFTSVNAAKAALNIPSLVKWKDVLSFVDPEDVAPPPAITTPIAADNPQVSPQSSTYTSTTVSSQPSFEESFGPPPGLSEPTTTSYLPSSGRSQGSFFDVSVTVSQDDHAQYDDKMGLLVDMSNLGISSPTKNDASSSTITSLSSSAVSITTLPNTPMNSNSSNNNNNTDSPRGLFRKAAPPPILTSDLASIENPTPKSVQSLSPGPSPTSTPGGTPHLSFTFFDSSAPAGITTLPRETLPKPIHDVMNTLCDIYYVPQKTWEKSVMGDYLFCQAIIDILSGQFNGVFVQMTKLKQQLKRKLGGSIRIGPLKALVIAYPEYFEVDRTVNLVRSLKSELPYMDISVITSA